MAQQKRVAIATLGCKVNTFESELIAQRLCAADYQRVNASEVADIYIINSCTVTAEADRQSRQMARKLKGLNKNAKVIMTGCYAQNNAEEAAQLEAVDWVVGNAAKLDIPDLILNSTSNAPMPNIIAPEFDALLAVPKDLLAGYESRSRAFIQIQQGCDQGCTFCIIHVARGPSTSFPASTVLAQYEKIVAQGFKEVVICGVDLGSYGDDFQQELCLADLLRDMLALNLDCRIRISSIDPIHLSGDLIDLIGNEPQICSQIHLSMQSANSLILKRMKRRASRELIFERVAKLRDLLPDLVLSADVLVGFPTETEAHFSETLDAIESLQIAYPHVFPYSNREGTPAARIPKQVDGVEKKRRARLARELGKTVWQKQAQNRLLTQQRTIVETHSENEARVRCEDYFPVKLLNTEKLPNKGQWCDVKITGIEGQSLLGEILSTA